MRLQLHLDCITLCTVWIRLLESASIAMVQATAAADLKLRSVTPQEFTYSDVGTHVTATDDDRMLQRAATARM